MYLPEGDVDVDGRWDSNSQCMQYEVKRQRFAKTEKARGKS